MYKDEIDEVQAQKIKYVTLDEHFKELGMPTYTQLEDIAKYAVKLFELPGERNCFQALGDALIKAGYNWKENM